ncbi:MAG: hypothetical protein AAGH88_06320 [Planctomycetota bacterium]
MPEPAAQRVNCPHCNKGYRWSDKLAGRLVDCKQCGERFVVPNQPGIGIAPDAAPTQDDTYELALDEDGRTAADPEPKAAPAVGGRCPVCNTKVPETAVICLNCGFNMKEGKRVETAVVADASEQDTAPENPQTQQASDRARNRDDYDSEVAADTARRHRWEEIIFPLIVVGVGLFFALLNALVLAPYFDRTVNTQYGMDVGFGLSALAYVVVFALTIVLMFPILLGGIFFMAAVLGSSFGNLFTALLKLAALVTLVVAVDDSVAIGLDIITGGFGGIGWFIRIAILVAVFYPLCSTLFDMEHHEIGIMILFYLIAPMFVGILVYALVSGFF